MFECFTHLFFILHIHTSYKIHIKSKIWHKLRKSIHTIPDECAFMREKERVFFSSTLMWAVLAGCELEEYELELQSRGLVHPLQGTFSPLFFLLPNFSLFIYLTFSISVWCSPSVPGCPSMLRVNEGGWCELPLVTRAGRFNRAVTQTWHCVYVRLPACKKKAWSI